MQPLRRGNSSKFPNFDTRFAFIPARVYVDPQGVATLRTPSQDSLILIPRGIALGGARNNS